MWDVAELGLKVKSDDFVTATDRMRKFKGEAEATETAVNRLARVAGTMAGALAGAFAISKLTAYADAWSDMQSKVGSAVKNMDAAPKLMKRMVEVANASYSPLQQTVEVYTRNVAVLRELGLGADAAADFTESLNHMLVITATKGERAANVQGALSKAMAVGVLQAEGLETVLNSGGRVAEALAKELGTSTNGLRAMASQGKITSAVIANALLKSLVEVREEAAKMPATIGDGFTRISTNVQAFVGQLDQALGLSQAVALGLVAFADAILVVTNSGFITWLTDINGAATLLGQALLVLAATQIPSLIGVMVAAGIAARAVGVGFMLQYYATLALAGAMNILRTAMSFLGGPLGIALGAATLLAIAFSSQQSEAAPLADTLKNVAVAQRDFNSAMTEYDNTKSNTALVSAKEAADVAVKALQEAVKSAREELAKTTQDNGGTTPRGIATRSTVDQTAIDIAEGRLINVQKALDEALVKQTSLSEAQIAAANAAGIAVENMTTEQARAYDSALSMLQVSRDKLALLELEKQYGAESVGYLLEQYNQERNLYFAKVDSLAIQDSLKQALKDSWYATQEAEGGTREWTAAMEILDGVGNDVWATVKNIAATEPGEGWLDNAIAKASTLWARLSDAAAALGELSGINLDDAGNPIAPGGPDRSKKPRRPPSLLGEAGTAGGGGGGGGGGGAAKVDQYADEVKKLKESTQALQDKAAAMTEAAASGQNYERALSVLEEKQKLLNAAQEAGVAVTPKLKAEVEAIATAYVDATEQLTKMQEQTQKGKAAFENLFGAILQGADAAKQAVINLLLEIAKVQFTKGMMGLLGGSKGGSGLINLVGGALSMDGGGYTGNGTRSGGVDGKGGFWGIMHPKETVIDHTKGNSGPTRSSGSGGGKMEVEVRAYVDDDGNWQAQVEKISDRSASKVGSRIAKEMTGAVQKINTQNPRRR